ncbi:MAG: tetratricopeptide repeat protein [Terracidiphilus sp.]|jgi:tetratricopeptide (TPR) repeat protein
MKRVANLALFLGCYLAVAPRLHGQSQPSAPPANPDRTQQQNNQNPFPEDTNSVPLMPSRDNPNLPPSGDEARQRLYLPEEDSDPVRSPEQAGVAAEAGESSSSSSLSGMGNLLPGPDDDTQTPQPGRHSKKGTAIEPEHKESAAEDENVGKYYLDNKAWKAALSRFESALVLDPDNPDVYWGLAESQRHLGNFAEARANYQKVVDYDPDSRHGKDARKALKDPEITNAKASAQPNGSSQPSAPTPQ